MSKQTDFIESIAPLVQKYAPQYDILCNSAVIAQAILESGWGESRLSAQYHNYFGLKCGTLWTGKSVNMATQEEYTPGVTTNITDNFRVYDSVEEGVKGYFDFIQLSRYQNLKGITDYRKYLETIRADGYATSSSYVESTCRIVEQYGLTKYDAEQKEGEAVGVTAETILNIMRSWIGLSRPAGTHKVIIDTYNAHTPRARGYAVGYSDAYCDTTISAAFIKANAVDLIGGTECGVEEHVKLFAKAGIWIEDGTIVPQAGDIIVFNWDDSTQPNDGYSDHIGIVESVSGSTITTIEGNMNGGVVGRRSIPVGYGYIRGYARPKYQTATLPKVEVPFVRELHPVETKKGSVSVTYMNKGCTGTMVKVLQTILNDVADAKLTVNGEFDAATVKALKAWQKTVGVTASGKTGAVTWRQLALKANEMTFKA